jgi:hypothetical protein
MARTPQRPVSESMNWTCNPCVSMGCIEGVCGHKPSSQGSKHPTQSVPSMFQAACNDRPLCSGWQAELPCGAWDVHTWLRFYR